MNKILITSGCSFSECIDKHPGHHVTWPKHLSDILEKHGYTHISCGMRSQGNGMIARHAEYEIIKVLKTHKPQDILVGIMWSGSNRIDYRCPDNSTLSWGDSNPHVWQINPQSFVDGAEPHWVIGNIHWDSIEFSNYYKYYYSDIGGAVNSLEHILRMQYFLKTHNIPYFFTDYVDNNIVPAHLRNDAEVTYLFDQLDRSQYLPVSSEHRWVYENADEPERTEWIASHKLAPWVHPWTNLHKQFVERVIYPYLQTKQYI